MTSWPSVSALCRARTRGRLKTGISSVTASCVSASSTRNMAEGGRSFSSSADTHGGSEVTCIDSI